MAPPAAGAHDRPMLLELLPFAIVTALALIGAVAAGLRATSGNSTVGGEVGLWVMTVLLALVALAAGAVTWWLWRFSVEFTF